MVTTDYRRKPISSVCNGEGDSFLYLLRIYTPGLRQISTQICTRPGLGRFTVLRSPFLDGLEMFWWHEEDLHYIKQMVKKLWVICGCLFRNNRERTNSFCLSTQADWRPWAWSSGWLNSVSPGCSLMSVSCLSGWYSTSPLSPRFVIEDSQAGICVSIRDKDIVSCYCKEQSICSCSTTIFISRSLSDQPLTSMMQREVYEAHWSLSASLTLSSSEQRRRSRQMCLWRFRRNRDYTGHSHIRHHLSLAISCTTMRTGTGLMCANTDPSLHTLN